MDIYGIIQEINDMKENLVYYNDFIVEKSGCSLSKKFLISETIFKVISHMENINDFLEKIKEN